MSTLTDAAATELAEMRLFRLCAIAAFAFSAAQPAAARNCYEGFTGEGCPWKTVLKAEELKSLSCENLSHVRNQLFNERGYCFSKPALADLYDNSDCSFSDQDDVPLNNHERTNIERILKIEKDKGC